MQIRLCMGAPRMRPGDWRMQRDGGDADKTADKRILLMQAHEHLDTLNQSLNLHFFFNIKKKNIFCITILKMYISLCWTR